MEKKFSSGIRMKLVSSEADVNLDMALNMLETIISCRKSNRVCAMIVPVGPTAQYPILSELVNRLNISLTHVHFFNMDEYMLTPTRTVDKAHFMSFHRRMETEFYDRIKPNLAIPENQRHFPEQGSEQAFDDLLASLGGAEACFGGLGINGHLAFNEPPEADEVISSDDFRELGTRVLPISRETRTINAYGYQRGDIRGMPEYCITIGMKQILSSHKIYIALTRDWQHGIAKHVLHDQVQPQIPATLLQGHKDVLFCAPESIGSGL